MTLPTWFARVRWIILLPFALFVGLGAWALASPIGASPDDDFHLASIWCAGGDRPDLCALGEKPTERTVDSSLVNSSCFAFDQTVSASCQDSLDLFQADTPKVTTDRGSFSSNYPPVYYAVMNWFASPDIQLSALIMRFLNILFFIGSCVALWFLLPRENHRSLLLMWTVTTVPVGLSFIASNNPSSWAIIGVPTAWFALYGFLKRPDSANNDWGIQHGCSRRRIALAGVFIIEAFLASGARADAALYTVIGSMVAVALTWRRSRDYAYALVVPAVMAVVSALLFLLSGQSAVATQGFSSNETSEMIVAQSRTALGVLAANIAQLPFLWVGAFGSWGLGWLDTEMPAIVWATSAGIAVGILFFALGKSSRARVWTAAVIGGLTALIPLYVLQQSLSYVGEQVQPRYILPLVILFAGILLLSFESADVALTRPQGLLVALLLTAANAMALFVNMRRYITGVDRGKGFDLGADIEWWWHMPVTPMVVWAVGSLAFAGVFLSVFHLAQKRR